MQYWKVLWHHDDPDDPVELYNEIGEDDYEVRKVELFRDGRAGWADQHEEAGGSGLGQIPCGPIEDVQAQDEFSAWHITKEAFEQVWAAARS